MQHSSRGFTLIELLVVVAIIGILAATILASLGSARAKSVDARIKSTMSSIRSQGELFYGDHGSFSNGYGFQYVGTTESTCNIWYGGLFDASQTNSAFSLLRDAAYLSGGGSWGAANCYLGASGQSYAAAVRLRSGTYWCVDSNGGSRELANLSGMAFNQGQVICP